MYTDVILYVLFFVLAVASGNMNNGGIEYQIMNNQGGAYSTDFTSESPEYFDVYGEIQTRYSQVYWIKSDPIPLPDDIVTRFKGKVMAVTGCTCDRRLMSVDVLNLSVEWLK